MIIKIYLATFTKKLNESDLVIVNLETTLTDTEEKDKYPNKVFNYKLSSRFSNILKIGNIGHVNLANNHICDYQKNGLLGTQKNLKKLEISYVGADLFSTEAKKYIIRELKNKDSQPIKNWFFSICDHMEEWEAKKEKHGIFYIPIKSGKMNRKQKKLLN